MRMSFLFVRPSWEGWLQQTVQDQPHDLHPCAFHKGTDPMREAYRVQSTPVKSTAGSQALPGQIQKGKQN